MNCLPVLLDHGPLVRYVKLWVAHAPEMPGTFSPPLRCSDPDTHYGSCVTHMPWCMPGSLNSDFLWNRWRGKLSWHSCRMRNAEFYAYGKRSIDMYCADLVILKHSGLIHRKGQNSFGHQAISGHVNGDVIMACYRRVLTWIEAT